MKKFSAFVLSMLAASSFCLAEPVETAAKSMTDAVAKGDLAALPGLIPEAYVKDADSVVKLFGEKMDPEIWNKAMAFLSKTATTVGSKADYIAKMVSDGEEVAAEKAKETADTIRATAADVANLLKSEAMKLDSFRKGSVEKLLEALTPFTKKIAASALKDVDFTVKVKDGENAGEKIVTVTPTKPLAGSVETRETTDVFVQVGGKWIPKDLADEWTKGVDEVKKSLSALNFSDGEGAAMKAQILMMIQQFQPVITSLDKANSYEEFEKGAQQLVLPLLMMGASMGAIGGED